MMTLCWCMEVLMRSRTTLSILRVGVQGQCQQRSCCACRRSLDAAAVSSLLQLSAPACAVLRAAVAQPPGQRAGAWPSRAPTASAQQHKPPLSHTPGLTLGPTPPSASPYHIAAGQTQSARYCCSVTTTFSITAWHPSWLRLCCL